jgi:hypothetical protein
MAECELLVFTARGRAPLFQRMVQNLSRHPAAALFTRRIVSVDGLDHDLLAAPELAWFTDVRVLTRPSGYYANICQGMDALRAPYFFWCEDDYLLSDLPPIGAVAPLFARFPALTQIRLHKAEPLLLEQCGAGLLAEGIYANRTSYSFWPHYGRRDRMRQVLASIQGATGVNVEVAVSRMMREAGALYGVWSPAVCSAHHYGNEMPGGHSDYATHCIGTASERTHEPVAQAPGRHPASAPRGARSQAVRGLIRPLLFLPLAAVRSLCLAPFDRQARAFVRHVWNYWHPDLIDPSCAGPTRGEDEVHG